MFPEPFADALVLTGPTGSGKSGAALALAPKLNAEIVSMDSMALYRGMDIGTAKPSAEERRQVPHHLLDVLDPWEAANVAWWLERAAECCRDLRARGQRPLFVGGTPLYLQALLHGLCGGPPADAAVRCDLEETGRRLGSPALHRRLAEVDPATAARLHPNDLRRIVRALEVHALTGRPLSEFQTQWPGFPASAAGKADGGAPAGAEIPPRILWVDLPRQELYARIDRRVDAMLAAGWVDEVRRLAADPRGISAQARQALGYREILEHLAGARGLGETRELIQRRTRQFAKRQRTWMRRLPGVAVADAELTWRHWGSTMVE